MSFLCVITSQFCGFSNNISIRNKLLQLVISRVISVRVFPINTVLSVALIEVVQVSSFFTSCPRSSKSKWVPSSFFLPFFLCFLRFRTFASFSTFNYITELLSTKFKSYVFISINTLYFINVELTFFACKFGQICKASVFVKHTIF